MDDVYFKLGQASAQRVALATLLNRTSSHVGGDKSNIHKCDRCAGRSSDFSSDAH